jgi:asparagine synthase (glutamine-hydrolysing)
MGHSLELRTPLVDAALLETLGPFVSGFAGGVGKAMLAQSPKEPLPNLVVSRPKTGFSLPMGTWLSDAVRDVPIDLPLVAAPRMPWARRWAQTVMAGMANESANLPWTYCCRHST